MLPSLFSSDDRPEWNVGRAGVYGAGIGLAAALVKTLGPGAASPRVLEIAGAIVGFAALCAAVAAVRIWLLGG
jgi:hypothetical protein